MKKILFVLLFGLAALAASPLQARQTEKQEITAEDYTNTDIEMADRMRAEGKIYVVVAIIGVIFAGLIVYAVSIDRKISRLEKDVSEKPRLTENA